MCGLGEAIHTQEIQEMNFKSTIN